MDNINITITPNNSHNNSSGAPTANKDASNNQVVANAAGDAVEKEKKSGFGRKEKSVLQTKLTRLAIQIGYAGMVRYWQLLLLYRWMCSSTWNNYA